MGTGGSPIQDPKSLSSCYTQPGVIEGVGALGIEPVLSVLSRSILALSHEISGCCKPKYSWQCADPLALWQSRMADVWKFNHMLVSVLTRCYFYFSLHHCLSSKYAPTVPANHYPTSYAHLY
jgi:hypothetical protein